MSWLEIIGVVFGLVCTVLTFRQSIWRWPLAMVSVAALGVFFWQHKLYADAGLQLFYFGASIFGWWSWLRAGPDHGRLPMRVLSPGARWVLGVGTMLAGVVLWQFLARFTDAALPFPDAFSAVLSVAAYLLLMRKIFENWACWIAANFFYIPMYVMKGLPLTTSLYGIYLVLVTIGFLQWLPEARRAPRVAFAVPRDRWWPALSKAPRETAPHLSRGV